MATSPRQEVTFEQWLTFPEDELHRTELIDGEVWELPEPTLRHQEIQVRLIQAFANYLDEHGGGHVYPPVNVRLAADLGVCPDVVVVRERPADPLYLDGPPDLVVEIVSDARRDLVVKRERYERHGVPEYWAILPEADRLEVYRLAERAYGKPLILEPPETVSPLVLPGLVIDLAWLFRR